MSDSSYYNGHSGLSGTPVCRNKGRKTELSLEHSNAVRKIFYDYYSEYLVKHQDLFTQGLVCIAEESNEIGDFWEYSFNITEDLPKTQKFKFKDTYIQLELQKARIVVLSRSHEDEVPEGLSIKYVENDDGSVDYITAIGVSMQFTTDDREEYDNFVNELYKEDEPQNFNHDKDNPTYEYVLDLDTIMANTGGNGDQFSEGVADDNSASVEDVIGTWIGDGMDVPDVILRADGTGEDYVYYDGDSYPFTWKKNGNTIETFGSDGSHETYVFKNGCLYNSWGTRYDKK